MQCSAGVSIKVVNDRFQCKQSIAEFRVLQWRCYSNLTHLLLMILVVVWCSALFFSADTALQMHCSGERMLLVVSSGIGGWWLDTFDDIGAVSSAVQFATQ